MQRAGWIAPRGHWARIAACVVAWYAVVSPAGAQATKAPAGTLARIRQAGKVNFGYLDNARPFTYRDASANVAGFGAAMCMEVADALKGELGLPALKVEWVPVTVDERFNAVQQGKVDLLCGGDSPSAARRKVVAFSTPIFPDGISALVRKDADSHLRDVLTGVPSTDPLPAGVDDQAAVATNLFVRWGLGRSRLAAREGEPVSAQHRDGPRGQL
jgi:putrescine:ornithine antiporter